MKKICLTACTLLAAVSLLAGCGTQNSKDAKETTASAGSGESTQNSSTESRDPLKGWIPDNPKWDKLAESHPAKEFSICDAGDDHGSDAPKIYGRMPTNEKGIGGGDFYIETPGGGISFDDDTFELDLFNSVGHLNIKNIDDITGEIFYIDYEKSPDAKKSSYSEDWDRFFSIATYKVGNRSGHFQYGKEHFKEMKIEDFTVPGAKTRLKKFSFVNINDAGKEDYYTGIIAIKYIGGIGKDKEYKPMLNVILLTCENNNAGQKEYLLDLFKQFTESLTVVDKTED